MTGETGVLLPEQRAADGMFYGPRYRRVAWHFEGNKLVLDKLFDWNWDEGVNLLPYTTPEDVELARQQVLTKLSAS